VKRAARRCRGPSRVRARPNVSALTDLLYGRHEITEEDIKREMDRLGK